MNDPLKLTPKQSKTIERALASADKMREFVAVCTDAKCYQLASFFRRAADELESTIQNQVQEYRFDGLPTNWSTADKLLLLSGNTPPK